MCALLIVSSQATSIDGVIVLIFLIVYFLNLLYGENLIFNFSVPRNILSLPWQDLQHNSQDNGTLYNFASQMQDNPVCLLLSPCLVMDWQYWLFPGTNTTNS